MRYREIVEDDSSNELSLKLSATINQLASRYLDTGSSSRMSLRSLVNILRDNGISVTSQQLRDMVDNPPLNNIIANIKGDEVTFVGQKSKDAKTISVDQSTDTIEKMAKRAEKKRK